MDAKIVKQFNPGMGLGFGFVLLEIAGGAGFCVRAAGDRIFCVRDANTIYRPLKNLQDHCRPLSSSHKFIPIFKQLSSSHKYGLSKHKCLNYYMFIA